MTIIDSYKEEKAMELYNNGKMMDFLPIIGPQSRLDMDILNRWRHHFQSQGIPYLVFKRKRANGNHGPTNCYTLFKERRV